MVYSFSVLQFLRVTSNMSTFTGIYKRFNQLCVSLTVLRPVSGEIKTTLRLFTSSRSSRSSKMAVRSPVKIQNFFDLSALKLDGEMLSFAKLKGRVVLVENVASL